MSQENVSQRAHEVTWPVTPSHVYWKSNGGWPCAVGVQCYE